MKNSTENQRADNQCTDKTHNSNFFENKSRGASKLTIIVFSILFGCLGYAGYQIIPFYLSYFELVNQMEALARVSDSMTDDQIKRKLSLQIRQLNIPATIDDVYFSRGGDGVSMSMRYSEVFYVNFFGKEYDIHTFKFHPKVER